MAETIMPSFSEQDSLATVSTDLGSKSSASSVTGNDAFSKINTLNSKLSSITVITIPVSGVTVNAGATADVTIDCTKSGYIFLGVTGWVINSGGACTTVHIDTRTANTAILRIRNNGSSNVTTGAIGVRALYIKK